MEEPKPTFTADSGQAAVAGDASSLVGSVQSLHINAVQNTGTTTDQLTSTAASTEPTRPLTMGADDKLPFSMGSDGEDDVVVTPREMKRFEMNTKCAERSPGFGQTSLKQRKTVSAEEQESRLKTGDVFIATKSSDAYGGDTLGMVRTGMTMQPVNPSVAETQQKFNQIRSDYVQRGQTRNAFDTVAAACVKIGMAPPKPEDREDFQKGKVLKRGFKNKKGDNWAIVGITMMPVFQSFIEAWTSVRMHFDKKPGDGVNKKQHKKEMYSTAVGVINKQIDLAIQAGQIRWNPTTCTFDK